MNYNQSIEYIQNLTKFGFNFGLGRISELMKRIGKPQEKLKIIHVGGTNGKGSTAAILASILMESGYKVGVFSSPHLHSYRERYRINGKKISEERIAALITKIKPHLEEMVQEGFEHPTEFEVSTAICFEYFYEEEVDFLILEVGLGGSIDSTNVIATPVVSVITNVGMDHMEYLGQTLEEIATVKAGIIKDKGTVVTASQRPQVLKIIEETCNHKQATLYTVNENTHSELIEGSLEGIWFNYRGITGKVYQELFLPLIGSYQVLNASTALAVVEALIEKGFKLEETSIREGLRKSKWPARLEIMQREPLVVIDGAHNLDGAVQLKKALQEYFKYSRLILIIGMLGDKEREKVVAELGPLANKVIVTKPNNPRAGEWQFMAEEVKKYVPDVEVEEDILKAVEKGLDSAKSGELVCITGSLYMVATAREYWTKET